MFEDLKCYKIEWKIGAGAWYVLSNGRHEISTLSRHERLDISSMSLI